VAEWFGESLTDVPLLSPSFRVLLLLDGIFEALVETPPSLTETCLSVLDNKRDHSAM